MKHNHIFFLSYCILSLLTSSSCVPNRIASDSFTLDVSVKGAKYELNKWPQILSKEKENIVFDDISMTYDIQQIPSYIFIGKDGKVIFRWQHIGEKEIIELKNKLTIR